MRNRNDIEKRTALSSFFLLLQLFFPLLEQQKKNRSYACFPLPRHLLPVLSFPFPLFVADEVIGKTIWLMGILPFTAMMTSVSRAAKASTTVTSLRFNANSALTLDLGAHTLITGGILDSISTLEGLSQVMRAGPGVSTLSTFSPLDARQMM